MAKEAAKIKVYEVKRAFGKWVTVVEGIANDANPKELARRLKSRLACGGTYKDGRIELQGEHKARVKKLLVDAGFPEGQIDVE
jgi:translation initiation factor 1